MVGPRKKYFTQIILSNKDNALEYLNSLNECVNLENLPLNRKGKISFKDTKSMWLFVFENWYTEFSVPIIREMFKKSKKYKNGKGALEKLKLLKSDFILKFGEITWPFSHTQFNSFTQTVNNSNNTREEKDQIMAESAIKFSRIREINTLRNDYLEALIFDKSENVIPTLSYSKGIDFYIVNENEEIVKWDQKVAKSPTSQFKLNYGENWKIEAINDPTTVAKFLYTYQDENRFDSDNRILIVYLDEDVNDERIESIISDMNFNEPYNIDFYYNEHNKTYSANCFVILLY